MGDDFVEGAARRSSSAAIPDGAGRRGAVAWRGMLETLAVIAAFAGFGLAWAAVAERAPEQRPVYPGRVVEDARGEPSTWLIDGFNLLHAALLGGRDRSEWWTEPRRRELLERVGRFDDPCAELWVVFDGPRPAPAAEAEEAPNGGRLRRVFAESADAWLVARVRAAEDPGRIAVVTADRQVAGRVRQCGARVHSPRAFMARCEG
jgi:hypothetical protein